MKAVDEHQRHQRREDAKDGLDEEDCGERNGQDASLLSVSRVSSLHAAEDEPPRIEQGGERENVQGRADDREGPASSVAGRHIEQRLIAQFKLDGESSEAGGDAAGEDVVGGVTADLEGRSHGAQELDRHGQEIESDAEAREQAQPLLHRVRAGVRLGHAAARQPDVEVVCLHERSNELRTDEQGELRRAGDWPPHHEAHEQPHCHQVDGGERTHHVAGAKAIQLGQVVWR
mmetsp:Transcript_36696/g.115431  ORF Transcript_36696/g.115431 Transcript_36696/m.115431 type:complete len:231 (-) Transcript_36696:165-857(-)